MRSGERRDRVASAAAVNGSATKKGLALVTIPLLALFLVQPLIVYGCSCGHDFDFHLVSWFEAATQIGHGNLHPHWAFTSAWDAGEPRFVFYPPLSWYLGALLGLMTTHLPGLSETAAWTAVPIVFTWIALTFSGLTMWRLARRFAGANAALVASAVYMANPYMLFTAYERTAYGELLAAAWMPLMIDAVLGERITVPRIAIPIALLWLTNVPAAVMGCYALALLAMVRVAREWKREGRNAASSSAAKITGGVIFGLALAAFYLVPAAYERRFVQAAMAIVGGTRIDANFLFEHTGTTLDDLMHDAVLRTASWIAIAMLAVTFEALFAAALRNRTKRLRIGSPAVPHCAARRTYRSHCAVTDAPERAPLASRTGDVFSAIPVAAAGVSGSGSCVGDRRGAIELKRQSVSCACAAAFDRNHFRSADTGRCSRPFRLASLPSVLRCGRHCLCAAGSFSFERRYRPHRRIHAHHRG